MWLCRTRRGEPCNHGTRLQELHLITGEPAYPYLEK